MAPRKEALAAKRRASQAQADKLRAGAGQTQAAEATQKMEVAQGA